MYYFSYGSDIDINHIRYRPRVRRIGDAHLPGYRLTFLKPRSDLKCGFADIVKDSRGCVRGVLYDVGWDRLQNVYEPSEDEPYLYRRIEVNVVKEGGANLKASTYAVMNRIFASKIVSGT